MAIAVSHYRFGKDDGSESAHTWWAAEDANPAAGLIQPGATFLLRFAIQCSGGTSEANVAPKFQYSLNGAAYVDVTTTSAAAKAVTPSSWANGANTTRRLTGSGAFDASNNGCTSDGSAGGTAMDIAADGGNETECAIQIVASAVVYHDALAFRIIRSAGTTFDSTIVATVTVGAIDKEATDPAGVRAGREQTALAVAPSESAGVAASEAASGSGAGSQADPAAVQVAEASAALIALAGADSAGIAAADAALPGPQDLEAADSLKLAGFDAIPPGPQDLTSSDLARLAGLESGAVLVDLAGADAPGVAGSEGAPLPVLLQIADALGASVAEAAALAAAVDSPEDVAAALAEAAEAAEAEAGSWAVEASDGGAIASWEAVDGLGEAFCAEPLAAGASGEPSASARVDAADLAAVDADWAALVAGEVAAQEELAAVGADAGGTGNVRLPRPQSAGSLPARWRQYGGGAGSQPSRVSAGRRRWDRFGSPSRTARKG